MTSFPLSHFLPTPLVEEDQHQTPVPPLTLPLGASNSPPIFFDPLQSYGEGASDCHLQQEQKLEPNDHSQIHGSSDCPLAFPIHTISNSSINEEGSESHQFTREGKQQGSRRKVMNPDRARVLKKPRRNRRSVQDQGEQESNYGDSTASNSFRRTGNIVRVCSDCKTTTTPLWRTGPSGPKSLCNACGIRQRKARRAIAEAVLSGGQIPAISIARSVCNKRRKKKISGADLSKKHCFNDIVVRLSRSSAFHQVFPQDEVDAAILLMALSCGLICS